MFVFKGILPQILQLLMKRPFTNPRCLFALLTLVFAPVALAQTAGSALAWEETSKRFETPFGQEKVEAVYRFTNTSEETVTIERTTASCGCTVPSLDKKSYLPGESGELTAIFTIGGRQGLQSKAIEVLTKVGDAEESYQLTLEVEIPVPVTLKPRVRMWSVNGDQTTQSIQISLHEDMPMTIEGVVTKGKDDSKRFDYQIETITEGREYLLKVTPLSMDQKARDVFYLSSPDDREKTLSNYPIYLYVR